MHDECIAWWMHITPAGYGQIKVAGRSVPAHRFIYEQCFGPIPDGLQLDHLCRNRACVNPAHLEPVTPRENTLRSPISRAAINARKTHCDYGHPLSGDNVYLKDGRHRICKTCRREWDRAEYVRKGRAFVEAKVTRERERRQARSAEEQEAVNARRRAAYAKRKGTR